MLLLLLTTSDTVISAYWHSSGRSGRVSTLPCLVCVDKLLLCLFCPSGFQQLAGSLMSSGQLLPYQESVVVDMLHKEVQRSMENQWQMARLETKR